MGGMVASSTIISVILKARRNSTGVTGVTADGFANHERPTSL
jgi:hypothetical protein